MSAQQKWSYDRIASPGEAEGSECIFCGGRIVNESQPAHWVLKAVEDKPDADYVLGDGFAHHECTRKRQADDRKSRFSLPEVPD
jgi:hypothetical protein